MRSVQPRATLQARTWLDRPAETRKPDRLDAQAPARSAWRFHLTRIVLAGLARAYSRVRVEGADRLPASQSILCFSHQNWADPFYVYAAMPRRPRMVFFGPEQEDMRRGARNRLMRWGGVAVPYQPGNRGLVAATARVQKLIRGGSSIAIAGEGRIHSGEGVILQLREGAAYLALRAGVPLTPVAISGTSWLGFRRTVRVRIGPAIDWRCQTPGRPTSDEVARLTRQAQRALELIVSDFPDQPKPGPVGRWLTELFNDWPEGSRPEVLSRVGIDPPGAKP
jgi:1-acyl-sn-glycerol-3-phosphate acyltransferase